MKFASPTLNAALDQWARDVSVEEQACAHNLSFDERLAGARGIFFESIAAGVPELRRALVDYHQTYVRRPTLPNIPDSFKPLNAPALIPSLAPEIKLVRVEALKRPLELKSMTPEQLNDALTNGDSGSKALVAEFVGWWNGWAKGDNRENPCSFSARKDQCLAELASPNWPNLLRDKFGLNHYSPRAWGGPIPVALMEFDAGEVQDEVATGAFAHAFCIPTALDAGANYQFFPTPAVPGPRPGPLDFGCPMATQVIKSSDDLIAELIHPRLTYRPEHLTKVGYISDELPGDALRALRNAQLWALRIESNRPDFGAEL